MIASVTEILRAVGLTEDYRFVHPTDLARARARGAALHKAIELAHAGTLDPESLHPEIAPGFAAYLRFVEATGHEPEASELELTHPWGIVGHPDRVGTLGARGPVIIDYKLTRAPDLVGTKYQLAAYRMLWDHAHPERPAQGCFMLQLPRDAGADYRLVDLTDDYAVNVFTAAFVVWKAQQER